jgi:hypothetical protein
MQGDSSNHSYTNLVPFECLSEDTYGEISVAFKPRNDVNMIIHPQITILCGVVKRGNEQNQME